MPAVYRVYGFIAPSKSNFGFSTPVFENDGALYVQVIENDLIQSFECVTLDRLDSFEGNDEFYSVGDNAVYCTKFDKSYIFGEKSYVSRVLKQSTNEFIHLPYFYKSVHKFCSLSEPEYLDNLTEKDYLIRQAFSKLAKQYVEAYKKGEGSTVQYKNLIIEKNNFNNLQLFINKKPAEPIISLNLDYLIKDLLSFAKIKHKRLSQYIYFEELMSMNLEKEIFFDNIENISNLNFHRDCLSYAIELKKHGKFKTKNSKFNIEKYISNQKVNIDNKNNIEAWKSKVKYSSVSVNTLSFATFILTTFIYRVLDKYKD